MNKVTTDKSNLVLLVLFTLMVSVLVTSQGNIVNLKDWTKVEIVSPLKSSGDVPVSVEDQTTAALDLFFAQGSGAPTTLTVQSSIDNSSITVNSSTSFTAGDYVLIAEGNRFYTAELLTITNNVLTFDTPLDNNFSVGSFVIPTTRDLNVDGSTTSQTFAIKGGGIGSNLSIDVTRLMIHMETAGAVDLNKFGDLTALTNGVVIRRVDGTTRNIFNIKSNGEMRNLCFDWTVDVASNPSQGQNGVGFRYTFAGQDKHGVAVRLDPGDELQVIIQDDLTGLEKFRIIAEGHEVSD